MFLLFGHVFEYESFLSRVKSPNLRAGRSDEDVTPYG